MPDWDTLFGDVTLLQTVLWVVAAGLAIALAVKLWPFVKNAVAIVDALVTLPAMREQVASIHHETHTNDGSSIKDAIARVEKGVAGLHGRMDNVESTVKTLNQADQDIRDQLEQTNPSKEKS